MMQSYADNNNKLQSYADNKPFSINIMFDTSKIHQLWALYRHHDCVDNETKYVGICPLHEIFTLKDANTNTLWAEAFKDHPIALKVESIHETEVQARQALWYLRNQLKPYCNMNGFQIQAKDQRVICNETQEIFVNAAACAKLHDLSLPNLTNHLNGKTGFKTVKKRTYRRII